MSEDERWAWSMTATRTEKRRREGKALYTSIPGHGGEKSTVFLPPSSRPEGRLVDGRNGPVQRERLDVEMKPSVDQHGRLRDPFLGAVPFVARLRDPGIAARAEAVPHAGMSPPCLPVRGVRLVSPSLAAWHEGEGRPEEGFHGAEREFMFVSTLTVCCRRQQAHWRISYASCRFLLVEAECGG